MGNKHGTGKSRRRKKQKRENKKPCGPDKNRRVVVWKMWKIWRLLDWETSNKHTKKRVCGLRKKGRGLMKGKKKKKKKK